jgi:hypothetical protein
MSLKDKAILTTLSLGKFGLNRKDEDEAREVARRHGADSKSFAVTKRLLQGNPDYDAIRKFDAALGVWNRAQTLPWNDDGTRLLPTLQYDAYMTYMRQARPERERLVRGFLSSYEAFVQADRTSLGNAFRSSDYPDRWTVAERFAFRLDVQPVPDGKDFRVAVGKDEIVVMQQSVAVRVKEAEERARLDLFQRLAAPLSDMASKLGDTGKDLTLRTTNPLVENLCEILDLIPRLNITGDGKIEEFRRHALEQLASITPETLKDNDLVRSVAARRAQSILDEMSDFMGTPVNAKAA